VKQIKINRLSNTSKERENRIQEKYKLICGKKDRDDNSDDNGDFSSDDGDGCDGNEDAIDKFDWDGDDTMESEESSISSGDCTTITGESN
jgi:hypothetical protein